VNCPHCATPLSADARFCPACGKATAPTESGTSWPNAAGEAPDLVGKTIAGRYRIVSKLGEGGMGAVYRGEQVSLKRACAVKLLRPELSTNQMILQRFNAEAQAVAKLSHPNTVNIYDFGQDADGSLFIAMEFIEGRSLRAAIQREGPFPPARALQIATQVAASLSDAHAHNIVHRDLKPDNVMLQDRGKQKDVVRVLDFGIAKLRDDSRATQQAMTQAGDMLGTPQYMAPEQIKGEPIDGRTDVYALGCMIYEMVTGRLPFEAPTVMAMLSKHLMEMPPSPSQRRPDLHLPPQIDQLVMSALAKDARQRPPTMDAYAEMIGGVHAMMPGAADPNRSAPMSIQQPIVSAVTPVPSYVPPPPSFGPPHAQPPVYPHSLPPAHIAKPKSSSKAPLFAIIGVILAAGAGVGVWAATKGDDKKADTDQSGSADVEPVDIDDKDDSDDVTPPPQPDKNDPWADGTDSSGTKKIVPPPPVTKDVGTAKVPLPAGAYIDPPTGFVETKIDNETKTYIHYQRGMVVAMGPLDAGTNDPKKIAAAWTKETRAKLVKIEKVPSHGANRDLLIFTTEYNGVPVMQLIVLYITKSYRLGVLFQMPVSAFDDDAFQAEVDEIFEENVHVP
jgi:serine/threonine protein kinase